MELNKYYIFAIMSFIWVLLHYNSFYNLDGLKILFVGMIMFFEMYVLLYISDWWVYKFGSDD